MSEVCSHDPVEESTPHYHCRTACFTNTVFDRLPMTPSVTSFEKLPNFITVSVFEDVLASPEQHNQLITPPQVNVDHHVPPSDRVPPSDATVHLTRATLKTHQETCNKFLKNTTPNVEEMKEFVSHMIELVEKMATQYPTCFSVKPIDAFQPDLKERLTLDNLKDHQKKWRDILKTSYVSKIKEHMSETIRKMELAVIQFEYYQKEIETLRENTRQMEIIHKQQECLENMEK